MGLGAPILTEQGMFLDRWTASSSGTGVGQVYDDILYLSVDPNANKGDQVTFLSDPVKVSSDTLGFQITVRTSLGGDASSSHSTEQYPHGIPVNTIVKIGVTLTCRMAAIETFVPPRFDLNLSIVGEDNVSLTHMLIDSNTGEPIASIDWLKFT